MANLMGALNSDLATFQSTLKALISPANISSLARSTIASVRTASAKEMAFYGVLAAEALGFFTVGEIVGRRKLVGYRGNTSADYH